ncbi:MAG: F0F1 ATP synthase subunit gamma [Bacillota bacterium]|nr:F0F1 ATP synthase subunit gamma [Bacillota bacterium]
MSSTLETLQKQISSGEDLSSIVRTMKALAATSVRQYEKAAESLDDYYHTVELGLSVVLSSEMETPVARKDGREIPTLMLIFGSDHGLAGRFNEQIVTFALEEYSGEADGETGSFHLTPSAMVAAAGEQVITRVSATGANLVRSFHMPTSISAITPFIQQLLEQIEKWRFSDGAEKVLLFYNRPVTGGFSPQAEVMLPVNLSQLRDTRLEWESRSLPTYTMKPSRLLSSLLRQYFFVSLYRACALSLAAENTSRLAAMQAAEKNINERLDQLKTSFQQERQAAITEELLDIISGFRAVKEKLNTR